MDVHWMSRTSIFSDFHWYFCEGITGYLRSLRWWLETRALDTDGPQRLGQTPGISDQRFQESRPRLLVGFVSRFVLVLLFLLFFSYFFYQEKMRARSRFCHLKKRHSYLALGYRKLIPTSRAILGYWTTRVLSPFHISKLESTRTRYWLNMDYRNLQSVNYTKKEL